MTLFYLPASGTAPASPTVSAEWEHSSGTRRPLNLINGGTALADSTYSPDGADHLVDNDAMNVQFVSRLLPAQTIPAQTIKIGVRGLEAAASNNLFLTWKVFCVDASNTVLATLVAIKRDGTELGTAQEGRVDTQTSTLATLTVPFRIVLEVGVGGLPVNTATDTHNATLRFGESAQEFVQDADTTDANPYLEFTRDLKTVGSLGMGLVVHLSAEEASGANMLDDQHGFSFTQTNTVGTAAGIVGNARDFESSSSMRCVAADADWNSLTGDLTAIAWANFESTTGSQGVFAKWQANQCNFRLVGLSGSLSLELSTDGVHNNRTTVSHPTAASTATWYMMCGRHRSGLTAGISINAGIEYRAAHTGGLFNSAGGLVVGASENGTTDFFDGLIDQVALWNRVLSYAEEAYVYNSGSGRTYEQIMSADVDNGDNIGGATVNRLRQVA